ncbi:uncharacterized protein FIBRA_07313 [Fibroporia radiculosa]|uniref:NAD-binding protein n=1 Tax=Fibroporia radiculosa TaxID=599839 RepID=J4IBR2_9APHY|nr:uncharacterized protein FIBRA_07313 [Fibroporia radiculosa]CCM05106.1 predicted protein [Fibroporia radiculosa]
MSEDRRVAIVTGAGQGIGRAIALRLADDGIDVAVNDLASNTDALVKLVEEIHAKGRQSISVIGDVSDEENVQMMIARTVKEMGGLDIMIANAGIAMGRIALIDLSTEQWDRVVAINLRGVMLCYKYAAEQMIKQGRGGRIIGAASVMGKKGFAHQSAYVATKFAVRGLTQSLALELAEHKITVNAYAPGVILTPMTLSPKDAELGGRPCAGLKKMLGIPPNAPDAGPEVVASAVAYLVKPEAHFITGQSINVGGGIHMD